MYEIEKRFTFEAGHQHMNHDGKCAMPHGHSYTLSVILRSANLLKGGPKENMILDFEDISRVVKPMIEEYFDHRWINDSLNCGSPTVEFMSKWIYDYLKPHFPDLYVIELWETATARASYFGN